MKQLARLNTDRIALLLALVILALSLLPDTTGTGGNQYDAFYHVLAYATLTCAASFSRRSVAGYLLVLAVITAFSGMIELIQPLFGRTGEFRDLVANVVGGFVGLMMTMTIKGAAKRFRINQ